MKSFACLTLLALAFAGCQQPRVGVTQTDTAAPAGAQTVDQVSPAPTVFEPPPELTEVAASPKPLDPIALQKMVPLTDADDKVRADLPYAPAIGLDPVDGTKLSIRATTPMIEFDKKLYYFTSEDNKRMFMANPEQYAKGPFSHL